LRALRLEGAQAGAQSFVEGSQERLADRHATIHRHGTHKF
jgi:hypothetical protein